MGRASTRYSPGKNLAALGYVAPEQPAILVVYVVDLVGAESARLARAYEAPPAALSPALPAASIVAPVIAPVAISWFAAHISSSSSSSSTSSLMGSAGSRRRFRRDPAE